MLERAISLRSRLSPGPAPTNEVLGRRKSSLTQPWSTVDKAMSAAGGGSFFRSFGLERLMRDVQAARYHPLQEKRPLEYTARYTLGLEIE